MSQAEARAWWADVQHLRPDASGVAPVVTESPVEEVIEEESTDELAQRRRGRITGRPLPDPGEVHLKRADAVPFAEALALDDFDEEADRRTVHITGRPDPVAVRRLHEIEPRRHSSTAIDRLGSRPDRIAMWAVALGIFLVLLAAVSSSADAATMLVH